MERDVEAYTRVITPDAHSKAEPHFSDLQKAMLDATPDCIKVLSVDGELRTMNRAGCHALDVPEDSDFGMPWLPLLPADVRESGLEALREAAQGRTARFPGKSLSPTEVRYWDNLLTPLVDVSGRVFSILCVSRDVTAKTYLERELEEAIGREKLLSREMQHRIKNLFSVVSGLIFIAEKEAVAGNAPDSAIAILREKLGALSRASDAVFSDTYFEESEVSHADLGMLVASVLQPYGERCSTTGEPCSILRRITTSLALFLHELATNSVKYGALGAEDGHVTVRWARGAETLDLTWTETGGPEIAIESRHRGFGSNMVDRLVKAAGGSVDRIWKADGLVVDLHLPRSTLA